MKKLMILLCSLAAGVAMADEYGDLLPEAVQDWPRQFLESQNRPSALADENVYIVTNDVVFSGEAGESALRVAENASVCILICEGAPLTCHGGDGLPASSGGDGVVPAFSNETVTVYEYGAWDFTYQMPRFALAVVMDERLPGWQTLRKRLNRREWGETRQDAHLAQTPASRQTFGLEDIQPPCVAPEPVAAPSVAPPAPRAPAAPVTQSGAKGRKLTLVQTEFWG